MSRIGLRPIAIPDAVTMRQTTGDLVEVTGPLGMIRLSLHPKATIHQEGQTIRVNRQGDDRLARAIHGVTRALLANAVKGVTEGYTKRLELVGTGYRATTDGEKLTLNVGFTHPVEIAAPEGISFAVEKSTLITVRGIDKQQVGQVAADIRSVKKPEPYKGKGIRYEDETIRRKAGKAVKTGK